MAKFWVSKYALTAGLQQINAEEVGNGMIRETGNRWNAYYHGEGKEWHRQRVDAEKRAEEMRSRKIASLQKQIAKLEKTKFSPSDRSEAQA